MSIQFAVVVTTVSLADYFENLVHVYIIMDNGILDIS